MTQRIMDLDTAKFPPIVRCFGCLWIGQPKIVDDIITCSKCDATIPPSPPLYAFDATSGRVKGAHTVECPNCLYEAPPIMVNGVTTCQHCNTAIPGPSPLYSDLKPAPWRLPIYAAHHEEDPVVVDLSDKRLREAELIIEKLHFDKGDVLILKGKFLRPEFIERVKRFFSQLDFTVPIMFMEHEWDISKLSRNGAEQLIARLQEQMERAGKK